MLSRLNTEYSVLGLVTKILSVVPPMFNRGNIFNGGFTIGNFTTTYHLNCPGNVLYYWNCILKTSLIATTFKMLKQYALHNILLLYYNIPVFKTR